MSQWPCGMGMADLYKVAVISNLAQHRSSRLPIGPPMSLVLSAVHDPGLAVPSSLGCLSSELSEIPCSIGVAANILLSSSHRSGSLPQLRGQSQSSPTTDLVLSSFPMNLGTSSPELPIQAFLPLVSSLWHSTTI